MSNIYEKIREVRGKNRNICKFELDALSKLMIVAFENRENFDTLPKEFCMCHIYLDLEGIKYLFEKLGLKAKITKENDYQYGYLYKVVLED